MTRIAIGDLVAVSTFIENALNLDWDAGGQMPRPKYRITLTGPNGRRASFTYWASNHDYNTGKVTLTESDLASAVECVLSDALYTRDGFCEFYEELGFTNYREATRAYKACEATARKLHRIGLPWNEIESHADLAREAEA